MVFFIVRILIPRGFSPPIAAKAHANTVNQWLNRHTVRGLAAPAKQTFANLLAQVLCACLLSRGSLLSPPEYATAG
jgi:hypothetical protein